jgi:ABC-2 type transport system permease protein
VKELIRIWAFALKELRTVFRQKRLLGTLVLGPFFVLLLFGIGFKGGQVPIRTIVVTPDQVSPQEVDQYRQQFGTGTFNIVDVTPDKAAAQAELDARRVDAVVALPKDSFDAVYGGQQARIDVLVNEIDPVKRAWVDYNTFVAATGINRAILTEALRESKTSTQQLGEVANQLDAQARGLRADVEANNAPQARARVEQMRGTSSLARQTSASALKSLQTAGQSMGAKAAAEVAGRVTGHLDKIDATLNDLANGFGGPDPSGPQQRQRATTLTTETAGLKGETDRIAAIPPEVLVSPFEAKTKNIAASEPTYVAFYAPAVIALLLQHLAITLIALSIVRERLLGAMEVFRVSPVSTLTIVLGKTIAFAFVSALIALVLVLLVNRGLGVPVLGDPLMLWASLGAVLFASLGMGFLIGAVSRTENQAVQLAMLSLIASTFFGGFFIELDQLQPFAQVLSYVLPVTYGIRDLQDVMLRGVAPMRELLYMPLAVGFVCYLLATVLFRRQLRAQ